MDDVNSNSNITLNSDMGESLGIHSFGNDEALMRLVDVANVACGFHSGDPDAMEATVRLAKEHGVRVGAHPGLPDLVGFGRREMKLMPSEVESMIRYQVGALVGFLHKYDLPLNHIKPHGSLYGMLARDEALMQGAVAVAQSYGVPIFGLAGSAHQAVAEREGVEFVAELYVDLDYNAEGGLIIQRRPENTDPQKAAARVRRVLEDGKVLANDETILEIPFGSICIHSDTSNSPAVAQAVREALGR
ncbi:MULTISPECIES: 5-oxoprolinase subunit PxpA [unclassified Cryobacterium]|uniref:5-oxoprolinase subunit PxpA n=1 Tax=unclassified Cryobacterium TaxID=2649013 RepID=UPI00106B9310|nr:MULTISPECIES: 5-oxoprolinase subunit PxpA [unclassified Cryobacterium]TFD02749.1 5-oxoprolinase subunit PxpA [Cryobacterium sp. TMT1-66-1]TFD11446.1 5-oxoprolinase subunit PxpA [Cryobacterium sp. TMT1-2-2]